MATTLADGRTTVATAGTAVQLSTSTAFLNGGAVTITAETGNTGVIVVGGSTVVAAAATRRGIPLNAGDSLVVEVDQLSDIWLDTTVNTNGVTYAVQSGR